MGHQPVEKLRGLAVHARLHADKRTVDPVHLPALAQIERLAAGDRMHPHHGLRLRTVALVERLRWTTLAHIILAVSLEGRDMETREVLRQNPQVIRQHVIGAHAVGIEGLSLITWRRFMCVEERDVGRRPPEALIGVNQKVTSITGTLTN